MTLAGCQQEQEKIFWESLETRGGRSALSESPDPRNKKMIYSPRAQGAAEDFGVNIVKTVFDIEELCQDLKRWLLEHADRVRASSASVKARKRWEGATFIVVEEANISGESGESGGNDPLQDLEML